MERACAERDFRSSSASLSHRMHSFGFCLVLVFLSKYCARFGLWDDILAEPRNEDPALYPTGLTTAHYARGMAFASKGLIAQAEEEQVC